MPIATPTLDSLLEQGLINYNIETKEYRGIASDGELISFGCVFDDSHLENIEAYLLDHPNPEDW